MESLDCRNTRVYTLLKALKEEGYFVSLEQKDVDALAEVFTESRKETIHELQSWFEMKIEPQFKLVLEGQQDICRRLSRLSDRVDQLAERLEQLEQTVRNL